MNHSPAWEVALRDLRDVARDLLERAHQVLRRAGDQRRTAVGRVLAVARDRADEDEADRVDGDGDGEHDQEDGDAALIIVVVVAPAAAEAAAHHPEVEAEAGDQRGEHREEARHRHHEHVAVGDVGELVGEHRLDLLRVEPPPEAGRHRDGGVLRVAAGRERVGDVGVDDGDPRLRQVGHGAEALDYGMELRRVLARDDLRPRRGEGDLVGRPVLDDGEPDDDHEHRREGQIQRVEQDDGETDVEQA
jgi:hypothetical protein